MRVEVLAVGTELLLGQIVDTNSTNISQRLAANGIDVLYQTRVGDNHTRIVATMRAALARNDAIIVCGGLGPTQDDITREAIAEVMGVDLELDEVVKVRIERLFSSRGREMSQNNLRQAMVPRGAFVIDQVKGTAPGLICPLGQKVAYLLPGVPYEMEEMLERSVIPDLLARGGESSVIASRVLRTWGLSESRLAEIVTPRLDALEGGSGPTIAFLASGIEGIKVRVTTRAATEEEASKILNDEEAELRLLLGDFVFGVDEQTMEASVLSLLEERGLSFAVAESLTGGMVASRLVAVPGASRTFRGGIVSYASDVKRSLLNVGEGPVVTASAAMEMASGVAALLGADVGLGITGVAGPDAQDDQPPGTVFVGISIDGDIVHRELKLPGDRERVRAYATISALDLLRLRLIGSSRTRSF